MAGKCCSEINIGYESDILRTMVDGHRIICAPDCHLLFFIALQLQDRHYELLMYVPKFDASLPLLSPLSANARTESYLHGCSNTRNSPI